MFSRHLIFIVVLSLTGCGYSKQQIEATQALKKIQSTTALASYEQYGQMLIDAKVKVDEALPLVRDETTRSALNAAIEAYADAQKVWNMKPRMKVCDDPLLGLLSSYNTYDPEIVRKYLPEQHGCFEIDALLEVIWKRGSAAIKRLP